jgi:hypothetical protein
LLADVDEKSNIYREPSINSSYQVLASGFRGEDIYKSEKRIPYGGHDAIYFNLTLPLH